jgi:GMP synthase PP-ATPase subunit
VTKHESYVSTMIQDVNATFQGMAIRIIGSIDKIRLNLLKKIDNFYIKESVKKEFCEKVKSEL